MTVEAAGREQRDHETGEQQRGASEVAGHQDGEQQRPQIDDDQQRCRAEPRPTPGGPTTRRSFERRTADRRSALVGVALGRWYDCHGLGPLPVRPPAV